MISVLASVIQTVTVSLIVFFMQRKQKLRDDAAEKRADARKKESLLALDMNMANAKLSYAVAMAVKRGKANGEIEEGVAAYGDAKKRYTDFLNEQALNSLQIK